MWVSHPIKFTFVVERFQHSIHYISRQQIGWTHLSIIAKDGRIAKDRRRVQPSISHSLCPSTGSMLSILFKLILFEEHY